VRLLSNDSLAQRALCLCTFVWMCSAASARAQEMGAATWIPPLEVARAERPTFEYVQQPAPDYLRASLEVTVLLGLGFAQYVANHDLNSLDWDFSYSWGGLRNKLSPRGYAFDTNGFDTNFIRHSAAGTTYYWAARSNRLSILESLVAAFVASTFWEYIGELRELASLNDIITTPLTGLVLGELTLQLGAFFDRSCDAPLNHVLGALLGPIKSLHDVLDDAVPLREQQCDRYGLSKRGSHSFELSVVTGVVGTVAGPDVPVRPWTRLELHTQITAVETYGSPGEGSDSFTDGNVSELRVSGSFARDTWNDFSLRGTIIPLGLHDRAITAGMRGRELLFGLLLATEYAVHRFGEWGASSRQRDRYFELDVPGASLQYRRLWGPTVLTLELQAAAVFLGVDALALRELRALPEPPPLPTVARADGYNYALGVRLQPRVSLSHRGFQVGAELAAVRGSVITANDRFEDRADFAHGTEQRVLAIGWASLGSERWPMRLMLHGSWLQRWATLAGARAQRAELTAAGGLLVVF
jgi:hypothetical protein